MEGSEGERPQGASALRALEPSPPNSVVDHVHVTCAFAPTFPALPCTVAPRCADEAAEAAVAALQQAQRRRGSPVAVLAAMQRAEERHEQEQAAGPSKRARLLNKLEGRTGGSAAPSSSASALADSHLQTAASQLAKVLSGNAALAAEAGGDVAGVAAALVRQLAAGGPSKPVFQSKLSNLAVQLKKASSAADVPALAAVLGSAGVVQQAEPAAPQAAQAAVPAASVGAQAAPPAAPSAAAGSASAARPLSQQQFQQQVDHALALATSADPVPSGLTAGSDDRVPAAAAAAALQALAAAEVTVDLLAATGAGRKVQQLKRHAVPAVAAAAAEVVAAWKARLKAAGAH